MLCFVTEGEGIAVVDGSVCRIRPFQLYLLVPGMTVEFLEQAVPIHYYGIRFEPVRLAKRHGRYGLDASEALPEDLSPGLVPARNPQWISQQVMQLYQRSRSRRFGMGDGFGLRIQLEQFIHHILQDESEQPAAAQDERVERSIRHMEQHYQEKVSIGQLALAAGGMSSVAYSQLFRHETGLPPIEYLTQMRMKRAKHLLSLKDSRVKEVAEAVGFRSPFYFSRMFQSLVGVAPTMYMKRGMLKVAIASSLGFGDHLRAVGIEPVCEVDLFQYPHVTNEEYAGELDHQLKVLERSNPDMIICDHYHTEFKDKFKRTAAPVYMDFSIWDWKRNFERIADLVKREREASETLARLYVQIEAAGQKLRKRLGPERVTLLQVSHLAIGIQGREHHPLNELIYGELGLRPCGQVLAELWRWQLQPEAIPVLETEHLFIHHHHVLAGSGRMYERLTQTEAWLHIPAVRDGRVQAIPNWFVMSWTPLGRLRIVNELLAIFGDESSSNDYS